MIALVSGATATVRRYADTGGLGTLLRPGNGNGPNGLPWAMDNGAFGRFDQAAFLALLKRHRGRADEALWVAAPDVVGSAVVTLALFYVWEPRIRDLGYRVALVGQDGLTPWATPWHRMDALFVGGTTAWKLGADARELIWEAKRRGLWVHVGRVNSARRMRYLMSLGSDVVDSVDGTKLSIAPDRWIPQYLPLLTNPQTALEVDP